MHSLSVKTIIVLTALLTMQYVVAFEFNLMDRFMKQHSTFSQEKIQEEPEQHPVTPYWNNYLVGIEVSNNAHFAYLFDR